MVHSMLLALTYVAVATCLQLPFTWNNQEALVRAHYSSFSQDELPLNLSAYHDNMVIRVPKSADLLAYLRAQGFKIWGSNSVQKTVDIQLHLDQINPLLAQFGLDTPHVLIKDLPQAVFETYPEGLVKGGVHDFHVASSEEWMSQIDESMTAGEKLDAASEVFFKLYRPLASIEAWMELLVQTYPGVVKMEKIGETYEGRAFNVLHVSVPDDDISHQEKKTVVVTGGVHAREWISVTSVLYSIYNFLNHYENNPGQWDALAKLDFLFIPVSNPDGYEYSWTTDRLWRKNRQPLEDQIQEKQRQETQPRNNQGLEDEAKRATFGSCVGIDIDHSYDFHWQESSDTVCGEEYAGSRPFEAYELRLWDSYLNATNSNHRIWGYVDLHSYLQEILFPYAFSCDLQPKDEENLIELAYGISKAIRSTLAKFYNVLPACIDRDSDLIPDMGLGSALDYMYHHKSYWAYQIKLRDNGAHGFLLPEKFIVPVGEEIAAGLKFFCRFIISED